MRILIFLLVLIFGPLPAASDTYLSLSYGITQDSHDFNIWHDRQHRARRHKFAASGSSHDWAVGVGLRRGVMAYELSLFDQRSSPVQAQNGHQTYQTRIETRGVQVMAWRQLGQQGDWSFKGGAGLGYRESRYVMRGMGTNIHTTDRAPMAMLGLRVARPVAQNITLFGDLRGNFRPPVRVKSGGTLLAPLEHDSSGLSLHVGLQIALN